MIRQLLFKLLGLNRYLQLISYIFLKTYRMKWWLADHAQVRFLGKLITPGMYCLDIGANLGYISVPLSRLVGKNGKVFSVEPVPTFRSRLEQNLKQFALENVTVFPYALGEKDGETISMGTPEVAGVIRHGRTEVLEGQDMNVAVTHQTTMKRPDSLFSDLPKLDFIKCDVEGYELHIIPLLEALILKHQPILEIEITPYEHKKELCQLIENWGYKTFYFNGDLLSPFRLELHKNEQELFFFPKEKAELISPELIG